MLSGSDSPHKWPLMQDFIVFFVIYPEPAVEQTVNLLVI